jgi:alpha-mannosidase
VGEAFARQGLYSQRYLMRKFGKMTKIGSNVDSFGHGPNLPQFLKKSGMDHYVLMRPKFDNPVFLWESEDGSSVNAISLPGEYTTWFHEPTKKNIDVTIEAMKQSDKMPCCYGVGNHGGGPTKENIESIISLRKEYPEVELEFSTFEQFFKDIQGTSLETVRQPFEKVNTGCYAMDHELKSMNRFTETRLMQADMLLSMAAGKTGSWLAESEQMENLWKLLLFNQFHDTLGGTAIKEARDEALMQFSTVSASCGGIKAVAVQAIVNHVDTTGEGFPLFLFHTKGQNYHGYVTVELNWFCRHPLKLVDPWKRNSITESPYQG